jgi:hypothetical protein
MNRTRNYVLVGILIITSLFVMFTILSGCNKAIIDTHYKFDRAIIRMPDGSALEVDVKTWSDYDGEQIQIVAIDGTVYLTSSYNCVLIKDAKRGCDA